MVHHKIDPPPDALQCIAFSNPAEDFRGCLNSVHPRVQFTMEMQEDHSIAFLDVFITRHEDSTLTTKIFPKIVAATFKGELCRCYCLCTSLEQTKKGHNQAPLQKIAHFTAKNKNKEKDDSNLNPEKQKTCSVQWHFVVRRRRRRRRNESVKKCRNTIHSRDSPPCQACFE